MKKNFLYMTLMLTLICFDSGATGENDESQIKRTTSSIDLGDSYKEKKDGENIYEKLKKFKQKNPSAKLPSYEDAGVLSVMEKLYDLSQKLGYEERKKGEESYYVIDISYPAIKRFAKSLVEKGNTQNVGWSKLKSLLETYGGISHVNGDKTKTNIDPGELNKFVELALLFFDLSKLENSDDQNKIREWIKTIVANYSGFQRIMLMMITLWIDFSKGVIVETPLTIKIEKSKVSYFNISEGVIGLEEDYFSEDYFLENREEVLGTFFHEISHAIHHRILCGEYFYRNAIPFFVSSISSSDALLDKFFPMLTKDNLDPEKNAVLKRIEDKVKEKKFSENLLAIAGGKKIEEFGLKEKESWKNGAILNMFYVIIGQGFGSIIFDDGWEDKSIVEMLTPRNIALVLYVRMLVFSTFKDAYWGVQNLNSTIDELKNNWLDLEEMLTLFGIIPFYFNGKLIVLEDRQNEQIFNLRNKQEGEIGGVYRMHIEPPSISHMNLLLLSFLGESLTKGGIFFKNNDERDKLLFPLNPIYIEDTPEGAIPSSELFFENLENSANPLKKLMVNEENIRN